MLLIGSLFKHQKQSIKVQEEQFATQKILDLFCCLMIDTKIKTNLVFQSLKIFQDGLKKIGKSMIIAINYKNNFQNFMLNAKLNFHLEMTIKINYKMDRKTQDNTLMKNFDLSLTFSYFNSTKKFNYKRG